MEEFLTRIARVYVLFERVGETVLLDAGSPVTERRGGLDDECVDVEGG